MERDVMERWGWKRKRAPKKGETKRENAMGTLALHRGHGERFNEEMGMEEEESAEKERDKERERNGDTCPA
jgi:hypothetical protein